MFPFHPHNTVSVEPLERFLTEAGDAVTPRPEAKQEIKSRMMGRITAPRAVRTALEQIRPADAVRERLKAAIVARITPEGAGVWDRLRASLTPPPHMQAWIRGRVFGRLEPRAVPVFLPMLRWTVAAALVLVTVRASPLLFVAAPIRADSPVLLVPLQGEVSVLLGGLWQPVAEEIALKGGAQVRTGRDGSATLIVHDDGVLRLGPGTDLAIHDLSDRPALPSASPTFSFGGGTLWAQGLMPQAVGEGWTVAFGSGNVLLHEGSVSLIRKDGRTDIAVWDRLVHVHAGAEGQDALLAGGEGIRVAAGRLSPVRKLTAQDEGKPWVGQNLQRDAVHRREIALLQQSRRAKAAGILPTSPIYPVKRVAEAVDMLFTFGEGARTQKRLLQASTRLNEAAALLTTGTGAGAVFDKLRLEEAAQRSLDEYRDTLLDVASGSGQDVQSLVQRQVQSEVADSAAALPDEGAYLLKKTVLETSAELPGSAMKPEDVRDAVVLDTLASLTRRAQGGDVAGAAEGFRELLPSLAGTQRPTTDRAVRRETEAALAIFADALWEEGEKSATGAVVAEELTPLLPARKPAAPAVRSLSEEEVQALAQEMYDRIFSYRMQRPRYNQLLVEFRGIEGHPDQGRILRQLYRILPENGLAQYVRTEFQRVRENVQSR